MMPNSSSLGLLLPYNTEPTATPTFRAAPPATKVSVEIQTSREKSSSRPVPRPPIEKPMISQETTGIVAGVTLSALLIAILSVLAISLAFVRSVHACVTCRSISIIITNILLI